MQYSPAYFPPARWPTSAIRAGPPWLSAAAEGAASPLVQRAGVAQAGRPDRDNHDERGHGRQRQGEGESLPPGQTARVQRTGRRRRPHASGRPDTAPLAHDSAPSIDFPPNAH
jgi:hypothetical protein